MGLFESPPHVLSPHIIFVQLFFDFYWFSSHLKMPIYAPKCTFLHMRPTLIAKNWQVQTKNWQPYTNLEYPSYAHTPKLTPNCKNLKPNSYVYAREGAGSLLYPKREKHSTLHIPTLHKLTRTKEKWTRGYLWLGEAWRNAPNSRCSPRQRRQDCVVTRQASHST